MMPLLRHSLHLLLLTAGFSLYGAVPAPTFSGAVQASLGGTSAVKIVGSKTVPTIVNGVDSGRDTIQPINLSGFANTWDIVTADRDTKNVQIRVQATDSVGTSIDYTIVNLPTTGTPSDVAVADVTNKTTHTDDIITAEDGVIRIYKNTRDTATPGLPVFNDPVITLTATATDGSTLHINRIAVADFNHDGLPDIVGVGTIVVGGVNQVQVAVFLSNAISPGFASFRPAAVYTKASARATGDLVAVGNLTSDSNLNGHSVIDPYPEIVVAGSNGDVSANGSANGSGYGEYVVFYNNHDGTFGQDGDATPPYLQTTFDHMHALAIADVTSDGHRDVIYEGSNIGTGQAAGQTHVGVDGGNDAGQPGTDFRASSFIGTNTSRTFPGGLAIGDFNGDGIPDIATILDTDGVHIIALPAAPDDGPNFPGANGFLSQISVGGTPRDIALSDINRNGGFDLVVPTDSSSKPTTFLFNLRAGTVILNSPTTPTFTPASPQYGQEVTFKSNFSTTVRTARVTFQRKGLDGKWVTMGSAAGVSGVFTYKNKTLVSGVYTFRASAVSGGKVVYSNESTALTIGLATPTIAGITPGVGTLPTRITIKEAGIPGNINVTGLTFTLQSSQDGSTFTDVPNPAPPNQNITISGANGTYVVAVKTVPTDAPYFRVVAHFGGQTDLTSPYFSLYAVDATLAQVTNDTTGADDTTQVVKTGAALGTNAINTTGLSQTRTVRIAWGDFQTFAVRFKNPSKFFEAVSLNGPAGDNNFEVRYFAAAGTPTAPLIGSDITSVVTSSGTPVSLPAGASSVFYVRVRTYPGTERATVINLPITIVVGGDPSRRDVVKLTVSATNALKTAFVTDGGPTGPGTLFDAITYANAHPGTTIEFEVPSDDAHWTTYNGKPLLKIPCTTQLPIITATGTVIDGTSQRELPDQVYSPTLPAICLVGYGIPDNSIGQNQPNEIGLNIQAANCSVQALMVTRFSTGLSIVGVKATNNSVFGCTFLGNTNVGVSIENHAARNLIGGAANGHNIFRALQENNVFYSQFGVVITGHSSSNKVQGNFFGVTEAGAPEPNLSHGFLQSAVYIEKSSEANLVGGVTLGTGNLISGNIGTPPQTFSAGVELRSSNNIVQGNLIGLTLAGDAANGNGVGVFITAGVDDANNPKVTDGNVIGSTDLHGSNVISGNQIGIKSTAFVEHTRIYGNYIGTNINALSAVPNIIGIRMHGYDSTIGGNTAAYRNVISGNSDDGILLDFDTDFAQLTNNAVYGNYIGVNGTNTGSLPNGANGVEIFSAGNTVGDSGPGLANIIANNTGAGVLLHGSSNLENTIRANSWYNNGALAIDIIPFSAANPDGVTPNDDNAHDADGIQNFPELTGATKVLNKNSYKLSGALHSLPNQTYVFDAYVADVADSNRFGQGKVYLGSVKLKADAAGDILFAVDLPIPAAALPVSGKYVTMTATQLITQGGATFFGGTSEFAKNVLLP